jgi:lactoylglutathione lyase
VASEETRSAHPAQLLHAMLRVANLERSLAFYAEHFGLREIRRLHFPEIPRTLVFIGHPEANGATMQLELWHEPAQPSAPTGPQGHVGIAVHDIDAFVARLAARGVAILQPVGALRPGGRRLAVIADPDGHELELLAQN